MVVAWHPPACAVLSANSGSKTAGILESIIHYLLGHKVLLGRRYTYARFITGAPKSTHTKAGILKPFHVK